MCENGKFPDNDALKGTSGEIESAVPSELMPEDSELPVVNLGVNGVIRGPVVTEAAEVVEDAAEATEDPDAVDYNVHETLKNMPLVSVVVDDELAGAEGTILDDSEAKASIRMDENERRALRDKIGDELRELDLRAPLLKVVEILIECMPVGMRKPEVLSKDLSRVLKVFREDSADPEMVFDYNIMSNKCKIVVGENGVELYTKVAGRYVLYCC